MELIKRVAMTGKAALADVRAPSICIACLLAMLIYASEIHAADVDRHRFAIASQPLGEAMDAFSRVTGLNVLMDSEHASHPSGAVEGMYSEAEALDRLLDGTGLRSKRVDEDSITIFAADDATGGRVADMTSSAGGDSEIPGIGTDAGLIGYAGKVQAGLRGIVCRSPVMRSGRYRAVLQLWFDRRGKVEDVRLLDTTGDAERDRLLENGLRSLDVGAPPPAAMPQPLAMVILPDGLAVRADCMTSARAMQ